MRCQYVIQPGDTFETIAEQFYNNPFMAEKLRQYNGLYNPSAAIIGQLIDIPLEADLHCAFECDGAWHRPRGFQQILDRFGNIYDFFDSEGCFDEGSWCAEMMTLTALPFPVALSLDHSRQVFKVRCHRKLAGLIPAVFDAVRQEGLDSEIFTVGDVYNFRSKRSSGKLSMHCWGIALDINPETNILGTRGCMPDELVRLFGKFGFQWGGSLCGRLRDPMHFQFGTGY